MKVGGFTGDSGGKESACNVGDLGSTPVLGRSPGEGKGYPLQYSGLEKSMDCIVHGVTKSRTRLSEFNFQGEREEEEREAGGVRDAPRGCRERVRGEIPGRAVA